MNEKANETQPKRTKGSERNGTVFLTVRAFSFVRTESHTDWLKRGTTMFNIFKKPTAPDDGEERRKIARQKQAMEKALRQQGLSKKQAMTVVSKTFKQESVK
jgi:hypothetical protein